MKIMSLSFLLLFSLLIAGCIERPPMPTRGCDGGYWEWDSDDYEWECEYDESFFEEMED